MQKIKWHLMSTEGHVLGHSSEGAVHFTRTFPCCGNAVGRARTPVSFEGCQSAALLLKYFSTPLGQPESCLHAHTHTHIRFLCVITPTNHTLPSFAIFLPRFHPIHLIILSVLMLQISFANQDKQSIYFNPVPSIA